MPESNSKPVVVVIGGGPAGLLAAGTAAASGASVLLFEKNSHCGRKLLITGAGRCNITSSASIDQFLDQYPENRKFLFPAFKQFFVDELKTFCGQYHLSLVLDDNGKYFPETQQAQSVLDVLLSFCQEHRVAFHCSEPVREISGGDTGWIIQSARGEYKADAVIVATGGLSYPRTGSEGDGYRMAASLSHVIVPTRPALVALEISSPGCAALSGISLRDVPVELWEKNEMDATRKIAVQRGDLLFTHFGVSGPPVLFLSRWLPADFDSTDSSGHYVLIVDLVASSPQNVLENRLLEIFASTPNRQLKNVLGQSFEIPHAVAAMIVTQCGFKEEILCQEMTKAKRKVLLTRLKSFCFTIAKTRGYKEAMVTAGGVSTQEIDRL